MTLVSGRTVDASGAPAPGVFVYATPAAGARFGKAPSAHSRRDGRWTLELAPGAWTIRETGHDTHDVQVGDLAVDLDSIADTTLAATPTVDDLARLLARRRGAREDVT